MLPRKRHSSQAYSAVIKVDGGVRVGGGLVLPRGEGQEQRSVDLDALQGPLLEPVPEQTGVVVCVSGRALAYDGFDRPETLARLWPRLVRGYAMEALGAPAHRPNPGTAERFLAKIASAEATAHDAVGLGTEVVLTRDRFVSSALVWKGAVVHLAAFREAAADQQRSGRIERPSRRPRRAWFHEERPARERGRDHGDRPYAPG